MRLDLCEEEGDSCVKKAAGNAAKDGVVEQQSIPVNGKRVEAQGVEVTRCETCEGR